jgi:S-disulfanyl-L-cysteine oxidoreductase SoxD
MSRFHSLLAGVTLGSALFAGAVTAQNLGLGRTALADEIAAWDKDIRPDGTGLPAGSGSVVDGDMLFSQKCAACHGDFAEGTGNWPELSGGFDTLDTEDPVKTVGSYWPYLTTTWDYINRTMPYGNAQSLSPDEVYAMLAYILYSNDMVDEDFVLSEKNLLAVTMPNAGGFIVDDRGETEYGRFSQPPCMENCKGKAKITMRANVLDVTPD